MNTLVHALNQNAEIWFYYMLNAAWQATLLALFVLLAVRIGRRWPSPLRYWLLVIVLIKFAIPPLLPMPTGLFSLTGPLPVAKPAGRSVTSESAGDPGTSEQASANFNRDADGDAITGESLTGPLQFDETMGLDSSSQSSAHKPDIPGERAGIQSGTEISPRVSLAGTARGASVTLRTWLMLVHLFGFAIAAVLTSRQAFALSRTVRRAIEVKGGDLYQRFADSCARMRFSRMPRLLISHEHIAPMAVGVFRRAVVVPTSLVEGLSPGRMDAVLLHELAHVRRRDVLVNWFQILIQVIWWFNPVLRFLNQTVRKVREDCCDDLVLSDSESSNAAYCRTLLYTATQLAGCTLVGTGLGFADGMHPLGSRMKRIMDGTLRRVSALPLWGVLLVTALAVILLPGLRGGAEDTGREEEGPTTERKPVEIRAGTEKRHRFDEYAYQEELRDGATHVLGTIHRKVVWMLDRSPYVMDENVFVAKDGVLTIEPGVVVKAARLTERTSSIGAYVCLNIQGKLIAEGRPKAMIRFTSESAQPNRYREWQGLVFHRDSWASILKWALVEDAIFGVNAYGSPLIAHCIFRECHTGIFLQRDFAGEVLHNVSAYNSMFGILCKATRAEATIVNNVCYENRYGFCALWDAVAYADYNLYYSSRVFDKAGHYLGMEPGSHDVYWEPESIYPDEDDFSLPRWPKSRSAGFEGVDVGLFTSGWSEENARKENEEWLAGGARELWYAGLQLERERSEEAGRKYEQALKLGPKPPIREKISCSLGRVLVSQGEHAAAKEILEEARARSEYPHLRDLARRYLAEATALEGHPKKAIVDLKQTEWPRSQVWVKPAQARYAASAGDYEDALNFMSEFKEEWYRYLKALSGAVADCLEKDRIDGAVTLVRGYRAYPLAKEAGGTCLRVAKSAREKGRSELAVELLKTAWEMDPFSREAPEILSLLAEILETDLKKLKEADAVRKTLCIDYFPYNFHVMQARKKVSVPVVPRSKMVLLDMSLEEPSIFSKHPSGSPPGYQYDVIRTLSRAGYTVHVNDRCRTERHGLTPEILAHYGLVIVNGPRWVEKHKNIDPNVIENLVNYVREGGNLLVVAGISHPSVGSSAQFYNPLVEKFGLSFQENVRLQRAVSTTHHPAVDGVKEFAAPGGVPVRAENGHFLGSVGEEPVIALTWQGKGKVIAAGLGSGFMGNTLRPRPGGNDDAAANNAELLVRLTSYLIKDCKTVGSANRTSPASGKLPGLSPGESNSQYQSGEREQQSQE